MPDIRAAVMAEMDRRGWRVADLARACPAVPSRTLYAWLGDTDDQTASIRSNALEHVLEALGIGLVRRTLEERPCLG